MSSSPAGPALAGVLEGGARTAAACVAITYLLGLCVVSLHLSRFGAPSLGLVRGQYILAGLWALLPLGGIFFVVLGIVVGTLAPAKDASTVTQTPSTGSTAAETRGVRSRFIGGFASVQAALVGALGWYLVAAFFLGFVTDRFPILATDSLTAGTKALLALKTLGFAVVISACGAIAWKSRAAFERDVEAVTFGTLAASICLFSLVGYVGFFTFYLYPRIPAAVGGGLPTPIWLHFKQDSQVMLADQLGSTVASLKATTPYSLLYTTDNSYIILSPQDSLAAVEVSKDLVSLAITRAR